MVQVGPVGQGAPAKQWKSGLWIILLVIREEQILPLLAGLDIRSKNVKMQTGHFTCSGDAGKAEMPNPEKYETFWLRFDERSKLKFIVHQF